jgi:hypothetical protein
VKQNSLYKTKRLPLKIAFFNKILGILGVTVKDGKK